MSIGGEIHFYRGIPQTFKLTNPWDRQQEPKRAATDCVSVYLTGRKYEV